MKRNHQYRLPPLALSGLRVLLEFFALLAALLTLLFFLLRVTGDPALVLAGPDATDAQIAAIEARYGLDRPLVVQYLQYLGALVRLEFGTSLESGRPALDVVLEALPVTLQLTIMAMTLTIVVCLPLGAWLGIYGHRVSRRLASMLVFLAQGVPGFVAGLLMIQLFSVKLGWLPSIGRSGIATWVLPTLTLASFLIPKLTRVVSTKVSETLSKDYIRTALACGASPREVLWRHALPNAMLGVVALIGSQFAYLVSGSVIVETMFAWPGLGWQLMQSTRTLDFPLVQTLAVFIAVLVFLVNGLTDLSFRFLDPRLRETGVAR